MAQSTITLTNKFADNSTRTLNMGTFTSSKLDPDQIRAAVKNLNADPSAISELYLSKSGAKFIEISQVKISTADKTVII